jgi:alkylation response protein AidB-like acyl-CoA dehydrogenase
VDFSYTEEQEAMRELARKIMADRVTDERLRELEAGDWWDHELWKELTRANLTGLGLPEELGGAGFGMLEIGLVLVELGRHLAHVPLFASTVLGGLAIAEFGSDAQRRRWLPPAANDGLVLTAALTEIGASSPARPRTTATRDDSGWRLAGEKECVPAAELAAAILVPARTDDDTVAVFIVDPHGAGVTVERQLTTNREPHGRVLFDGAPVAPDARLGEDGGAIVRWIENRALAALSAIQLGVCEEALRRTAEYTKERKQFGRAIGSFQAVSLRAADAFIDLEAMRSTLLEALWHLSMGRPADTEVRVAKWWACRGGTRITHTAQHLHGGIGADLEYPIHRFFLWAKQLELSLGGASRQLAGLGSLLTGPVTET